jgi:UDP:flavonoid glycosyltransferase YjiC (YdhE family)
VLCCPHTGDMTENSARVAWARAGLMLPWRLVRPTAVRWAARRILSDAAFTERVREFERWSRTNDGAERGAALAEALVRQ